MPLPVQPAGYPPLLRIMATVFLEMTPEERGALADIDAVLLGLAVFRTRAPVHEDVVVTGHSDSVRVQLLPWLPEVVASALREAGWKTASNEADELSSNEWWRE